MVETANLHTKHTGDNSSFKAAMTSSIGLIDSMGNKLVNQQAIQATATKKQLEGFTKTRKEVVKRYSDSRKLVTAYKGEKLSIEAIVGAQERMAGGYKLAAGSANLMTGAVRNSRFHTANLGAQFNDIGVMLAAGQSPFMLAIQQGTQISQVFAAMGGTPMDNVRAMGAGIRSMISPMSLMTIGGIAAVAMLVQWGRGVYEASNGGNEFAETLEGINKKLETGRTRLEAYARGFNEVESVPLDDRIKEIADEIENLNEAIASIEAMGSEGLTRSIERQRERLGVMKETRAELQRTLIELEAQSEEIDGASERSERLKAIMEQINTDPAVSSMQWLKDKTNEVIPLAERLAKLYGNAMEGFVERQQTLAGLEAGTIGPDAARHEVRDELLPSGMKRSDIVMQKTFLTEPEEEPKGRGKSPGEKNRDALTGVVEGLETPAQKAFREYQEKQKVVNEALEREHIDAVAHQELMENLAKQHGDRMLKIDRTALHAKLGAYGGMLGDLAGLMQSSNKQLFAIGKAAAIAEAIVTGISGAVKAYDYGLDVSGGNPVVGGIYAAASVAKTASMISQLRGASAGGGGSAAVSTGGGAPAVPAASAGGGSGGGGGQASSAQQQISRELTIIGSSISREQAYEVAEFMNEGTENGLIIRGRR